LKVFELAGYAKDAKIVAGGREERVALDAEPGFVLAVDGVADKSAVGAEPVKVLGVEIEVNGGDEQISLGRVTLAAVTVWSSAGHDGMWRPKVELVLAAEEERCVDGVYGFDGESVVGGGLFDEMNPPPNSLPVATLPKVGVVVVKEVLVCHKTLKLRVPDQSEQ
jgi:hypothetical protein